MTTPRRIVISGSENSNYVSVAKAMAKEKEIERFDLSRLDLESALKKIESLNGSAGVFIVAPELFLREGLGSCKIFISEEVITHAPIFLCLPKEFPRADVSALVWESARRIL